MDYKTIIIEKRDGVAYITLNRPDEANALDLATATELHEAALDCNQDAGVRAILITANGKMFCGGGAVYGHDDRRIHTVEERDGAMELQRDLH